MRQIFTMLTLMVFAFTMNAQYIYNDFDENQNETFNGWPNAPAIIGNPDISGINTSAQVAEWVRSSEQWAHVYCDLDGTVDFTTGTLFELKVHVPIVCTVLFKLEDGNGGFIELPTEVSTLNTWTQLAFDFTDGEPGTYNKIVIFFDFGNGVDNTYYFDDLTGPEVEAGGGGTQVDLPVTFDDENVNYNLADFGGNASSIIVDPDDETNMIAQSIKTEGAETWAGTTIGGSAGFANPIPFDETHTSMSVDVWSPVAGIPIRLKVEDWNVPEISCETEATANVANGWETLVFDFSNEAPGTAQLDLNNSYNKASIFFDFGTTGVVEQTYFWDNVLFLDGVGINQIEIENTHVYPNPAINVLHFEQSEDFTYVNIYSVNGQLVYATDQVESSVDVSSFSTGQYILIAKGTDGNTYQAKFIVK